MPVFDSNVLIYHLNDQLPPGAQARVDSWIREGSAISVITRIEVLGFPQSEADMAEAQRLLALFTEEAMHETIVQQAIHVRRQRRLRLPDAVIAATALHLGLPIVTRNEADFRSISGLAILNPFT